MDLFGTGLDGDKKTGKGFVLNKSFAADEKVRRGKTTRIAIASAMDTVGDDALVEVHRDFVNLSSSKIALAERVFCRGCRTHL
jgi:hypothetical protein